MPGRLPGLPAAAGVKGIGEVCGEMAESSPPEKLSACPSMVSRHRRTPLRLHNARDGVYRGGARPRVEPWARQAGRERCWR